ncbi:MAG: leucine-rich repeat protein [Bacteroidaceae bacterium]|nr:leucine-rich repeat protein [Bacteroidaceae bacterium]
MKNKNKSTMRRVISLLICLLIASTSSAIEVVIDGLYYNLSGVYATVLSIEEGNHNTKITIPEKVVYKGNSYTVNSIAPLCFTNQAYESDERTRRSYSDGVETSGADKIRLLGMYYIKELLINNGSSIEKAKNCSYVQNIILPNTITEVGTGAFFNYNLKQITLGSGLKVIQPYAFLGCSLERLSNVESITSLGKFAFSCCSIPEFVFSGCLTDVGQCAFADSEFNKISFSEGLLNIGFRAFLNSTVTQITIPSTVEYMDDNPFFNCDLLHTIIYLGSKPSGHWVATSNTYVPDDNWGDPTDAINDAHVYSMITFDQKEFIYNGKSPTPTWVNNVDGYTPKLSMPMINSDAGSHEELIPVTFTKGNESFSTNVVYRYTIEPAKLSAKVNNASREYGEENPQFSISYSGLVNGENENVITTAPTVSTTATKTSDVGEYPITISGGSANNYEFTYEPGVLTITKAPLTAKVNDETKQYGKDNPAFTISYAGLKNGETAPKWKEALKIETTATKTSDVGFYDITATGIATNYSLSAINKGILSVTQAPLTIKAGNATRKYFEAEPSYTFSCTGFVNDDNIGVLTKEPSFTTDATQMSNVGKYKITPNGAEAKNYAISYEQGELTITKRQLKATSHCSRLYGEENPSLPIEYIGFVNNETENVITINPIATTTAKKTSSVGEYPITVGGGESTNYDFVYEQGVLEITKASLSAKVNDATKVYGTQNPTFTIDYNGLKNGETVPAWTTRPSFQTNATQSSGVGQYAVKAVNGVPVNYELEIADGILSITPATLTIKANDATRQYYSDNPNFSYTCNGFVNGDNESVLVPAPNLSTAATRTSNVGSYEIKVGNTSSSNYSISYVNGALTVSPRTLTASVGDYERTYNEENPAFEVLYDGFVGNDNENVLAAKAVAKTSATKKSDVGTYRIDVTGGSADNYTFSYTPGSLTINKAEQTISWEQDLTSLKVGDQVELKAVASSGLPITYTMDNSNAAEIYATGNKSYLDCKAGGQFLIRAVQDGNKNYYSSPRASNTISIIGTNLASDPTLTIKQADNGAVKVQVSKGSVYTFIMAPNNGWKVHSVTYNNSDVTSQLSSDGSFTTPAIDSNSTLSVVYEQQGGNAVNSTKASGVKILATADGVRVIDGDMRDTIYIYTHDGVRQHAVKVDKKIIDIPLSKHDVYIVKVGNKTVKLGF